ncbi:hypothetical protein BDN72DRAFT_858303 [Pluteus cervinus]|uniref:Uncharacterized protein n=1 Tax=Pluteus cervinus TaxID=181527 RepID=A0ACD3ATE0_9AGAR|nr:hypothetical protein BDN72DRAFT_858303 [Pluteus cervinus]
MTIQFGQTSMEHGNAKIQEELRLSGAVLADECKAPAAYRSSSSSFVFSLSEQSRSRRGTESRSMGSNSSRLQPPTGLNNSAQAELHQARKTMYDGFQTTSTGFRRVWADWMDRDGLDWIGNKPRRQARTGVEWNGFASFRTVFQRFGWDSNDYVGWQGF